MKRLSEEQIATAEQNGISYQALNWRLKNDWEIEKAINTPPKSQQEAGKMGADKLSELKNSSRAASWTGNGNLLMCPVPGCGHIGSIITKAHCRIAHNKEREQIQKEYGMPFNIKPKQIKWEENKQ